MPKRHQQYPGKRAAGRNNPQKSTEITTGLPKKQGTYQRQIRAHEATTKTAQRAKVPSPWKMNMGLTHVADSRRRSEERRARSGSESNADKHRKGREVHASSKAREQPGEDYARDLQAGHRPAEHLGMGGASPHGIGYPASEIKELHTLLADLTDDELKSLVVLPTGTHLEQGAKYIDLHHLERGEFTAPGDTVAEADSYYVAKKDTDYVLWNRLNQITEPARLDEPGKES